MRIVVVGMVLMLAGCKDQRFDTTDWDTGGTGYPAIRRITPDRGWRLLTSEEKERQAVKRLRKLRE